MREQPSIPDWAVEHLRDQLLPGEEIINAVAFRRGMFSGLVLCNTSKGAALVAKGLVGAPSSALLTYPRDAERFVCQACDRRNLVLGPVEAPAYCSHCGTHQRPSAGSAAAAPASKSRRRAAPADKTRDKKAVTKDAKRSPATKRSSRCQAKTAAGSRCRNAASRGDRCATHARH